MHNVFLDLGTHYGQGLREFIERFNMNDQWIIHTFEANPVTNYVFNNHYLSATPWVISHNQAISDHDGKITLNIETPPDEGDTGQGSSLISLDKWDPWGLNTSRNHFKNQVEVSCIDFSSFIINNFDPSDNIIIKMDIEGSEYDVLEKMLKDGSLNYVSHISIEWHSRFFINSDEMKNKEENIIQELMKYNLTLENWK